MVRQILMVTTFLSACGGAIPAYAQSEGSEEQTGIEDIVVTAQRRSESVQDVPIAISAFSSEQLEAQGINNALQMSQYVPNLFAMNNTGLGSANGYYLRGLGNTESIATFDPPVGTYVDDIYLSRQNANNLSFLDVERVEVLRGPQGTLFGRNTTGGAINVIMRDPGTEVGGYAEIGYGRYDRRLVRASIDLPLTENFLIKASGFIQNDDGYVRNVMRGQDINDDDGGGFRIGFKVGGDGPLTWRGSAAHLISNAENILNFECNPLNPTDCKGRFASTGFADARTNAISAFAPLAITGPKANFGQGNRTKTTIGTSNLGIELGDNATVNFITGVVDLKQQFALDFFDGRGGPAIGTPFPPVRGYRRGGFVITNEGVHNQFTQELKLSGNLGDNALEYVGGLYYINERNTTDFADIFSLSPAVALLLADRTIRNKTTAKAAYLQLDYNLSEQLKVTAGIRYTDEKKTFNIADNRASCTDGSIEATCLNNINLIINPPIVASPTRIPDVQRAKLWTPRVALNFKPNDDMLLFLSATRGFKSGGWNARGTATNELLPFGPEKVWSYEAGVKSDLFDRRVRANLTLFYQDTAALQTPSAFIRANGSLAFITRNFADYVNKGAELELTFEPVDNLRLFLNGGFQDDKYKINRGAPPVDAFGVQSVNAQQLECRAAIAAGFVPGGPNAAGNPVPRITTCGAGIIAPDGSIAEPVRTPDLSLSLGVNYKMALGSSGWSVTPSVNASYASKSETGTSNVNIRTGSATGVNGTFPTNLLVGDFITGSESAAHWLVNASITLKTPNDQLSFGLECSNCLNESFIQNSLSNYSYLNRPMEWMIRAKYNF
jgi:iron complex outermembrane recepter protein